MVPAWRCDAKFAPEKLGKRGKSRASAPMNQVRSGIAPGWLRAGHAKGLGWLGFGERQADEAASSKTIMNGEGGELSQVGNTNAPLFSSMIHCRILAHSAKLNEQLAKIRLRK